MSLARVCQRAAADEIRVLCVDDDPAFLETTADAVERQSGALEVVTARSATAGLEQVSDGHVDCVVSDYRMPGMDGLAFLEAVREEHPDLPFILFTGEGNEAVASRAISAGVTDYLRKQPGTDQYAVLADRIEAAVERVRAEASRERRLTALETAQEGIGLLDADGRYRYVNEAYADLYGYDPAELVGEHWSLVYPDDEVAFVREEVLPAVDREGYWRGRTTGLRADGSTFPEDHAVTATEDGGFVCAVRDVSDRERREAELARYETVIEVLGDPVYVLDTEGRFTYVNDALADRAGRERADLLGEHVSLLLTEEALDRGTAIIEDLLASEDRRTATYEMVADVGDKRFTAENHLAVLTGPDGEFRGTAGVVRDVTDRVERERELERQNERLDAFASAVSHELRNPLNVAQGQLELARSERDCPRLETVATAHDRMGALIEDLLALAREGDRVDEFEPVPLGETVRRCWRTVATGDATLAVETDRDVRADRSRLKQLIENLVGNAVDHGSTDSGPSDADVAVTVGDLPDGFFVADDGPGIPEHEREQVFQAGYTHDDGTGFGLAIVKEIADAHGWTVSVTDSEAGGARFEVTGVEFAVD